MPEATIHETSFVSDETVIEHPIDIWSDVNIFGENNKIGRYTYLNHGTTIFGNVEIGRFCSIGRNVDIGLSAHPMDFLSTHPFILGDRMFKNDPEYQNIKRDGEFEFHKKTTIGHDVWIGNRVQILSGVTIGNGAVIAAGAVVTKDVKSYTIVAGIPAKKIKRRFNKKLSKKLEETKWWNLSIKEIGKLDLKNPDKCIEQLEELKKEQQ